MMQVDGQHRQERDLRDQTYQACLHGSRTSRSMRSIGACRQQERARRTAGRPMNANILNTQTDEVAVPREVPARRRQSSSSSSIPVPTRRRTRAGGRSPPEPGSRSFPAPDRRLRPRDRDHLTADADHVALRPRRPVPRVTVAAHGTTSPVTGHRWSRTAHGDRVALHLAVLPSDGATDRHRVFGDDLVLGFDVDRRHRR